MVSRGAMDAGLLPVKTLRHAKSRLAPAYGDEGRAALARALFDDALALVAAADFFTWWVVSDDDEVARRAEAAGLAIVRDRGTGLNDAITTGIETVLAAGARSVTVVPADVPLATRSDLQDLLDTGATSDVVVVPGDGGGTNALYLSPPDALAPQFGERSLGAHVAAAEARGLRCTILALEGLALDVDTAEDVDALVARGAAGATGSALARVVSPRRS